MFKSFKQTPKPLSKGVTVYGKSYCPHSQAAAALAEMYPHNLIVEVDRESKEYKDLLKDKNHTTIPAVFVDGKFVGGNSEFQNSVTDILEK